MMFDIETQKDLISRIEKECDALADYLYPDNWDKHVNNTFSRIEQLIKLLKDSYCDKNTYIKLVERETGEVVMKYFDKGDVGAVCYYAAKFYAFDDLDDTYRIEEIMCDGHELGYLGWQPGMLFEFKDYTTGEIVYSAEFPNWDH